MRAIGIQIWEFLNNLQFYFTVLHTVNNNKDVFRGHGHTKTRVKMALQHGTPLASTTSHTQRLFKWLPLAYKYDSFWTILLALCTVHHTANNNKDVFRGHGHTKTRVKTTIVDVALPWKSSALITLNERDHCVLQKFTFEEFHDFFILF